MDQITVVTCSAGCVYVHEFCQNEETSNITEVLERKFDEDSNSVVISGILKSPKDVGRENTGTTGIDVDKFLD